MAKAWRIVLIVVVFLAAAGAVLLGAAFLTGASVPRIVELVFGGQEGFELWQRTAAGTAQRSWDAVTAFFGSWF
jgi:hypothetical protein